jgi:hypothetical protein
MVDPGGFHNLPSAIDRAGDFDAKTEQDKQAVDLVKHMFDTESELVQKRIEEAAAARANAGAQGDLNDQMRAFLQTTHDLKLGAMAQDTTLWGNAADFLNDPLIKINGNLRSMANLWDDVKDAASGALKVPLAVTDISKRLFGDEAGGKIATQLLSGAPGGWENGDEFKFPPKSKGGAGGPAVRDTNWVQSIMSDLGSYLGAGAGLAQGGLQDASGGGIDFWDASGTLDRLKQLHDLEAAHIQPGIHADAEGNLALGGGLNGVITQVVQGMTDLVHQGMQWVGVDLWDPEKTKHIAEGLANMQRWNQELDGVNSKGALAKKQEYEEFSLRTGDVNGAISSSIHKISDDAMNAAKLVEKAFTGAFDAIEQQIFNLVDNGKFSFSSLAKSAEHFAIDSALRQTVGAAGLLGSGSKTGSAELSAEFTAACATGGAEIAAEFLAAGSSVAAMIAAAMATKGIPGGGGGSGGGDVFGLPGLGDSDIGSTDLPGTSSTAARARAPQIHIHMDGGMVASALSQPAAQSAITNVVYRQHGNVLSVRDRLRSRG